VPHRKLWLRRLALAALAALVGAFAALIGATPASAHTSVVRGAAVCSSDTGEWQVTWTLTNRLTDLPGTLTKVELTPADTTVTNIAVGAVIPNPGTLTGVQMVPGTAKSASLSIRASWPDGFQQYQDSRATVYFSGTCLQDQPKPNASFASACDGSVTVTLSNDAAATRTAAFVVTGAGNFSQSVSVAKGATSTVTVPASAASAITVSVGTTKVAQSAWSAPSDCPAVTVSSKSDCTSLAITLDNPSGNLAAVATLSDGTNPAQQVTVAAGASQTVTFAAKAGLKVDVQFSAAGTTQADPVQVAWTLPANCATTPPPSLPTTGSHLTPLIAAGAGLLAAGGFVLFVLFRRRMATNSRIF
jgi:LPXTG-motif cell wall-anchored protein